MLRSLTLTQWTINDSDPMYLDPMYLTPCPSSRVAPTCREV